MGKYNYIVCLWENVNIHISNDVTAGNHRSTVEDNVSLTHSAFSLVGT